MKTIGQADILTMRRTGFLASQKSPAYSIIKSYDWAKEARGKGDCIICGNHSQIEKDVFEILFKGNQPLILMLARGMKKRWEPQLLQEVEKGRLLILSPFEDHVSRVTRETAEIRNKAMIELANEIVVGHARPGGQLERLLRGKDYISLSNS